MRKEESDLKVLNRVLDRASRCIARSQFNWKVKKKLEQFAQNDKTNSIKSAMFFQSIFWPMWLGE